MGDSLSLAQPDIAYNEYSFQEAAAVTNSATPTMQNNFTQALAMNDPAYNGQQPGIEAPNNVVDQMDGPSAYLNAPGNTSILGECMAQCAKIGGEVADKIKPEEPQVVVQPVPEPVIQKQYSSIDTGPGGMN